MAGSINMQPGAFSGPATSSVPLQLLLPNALDDVTGCSALRNISFNGVKIKGKYLLILRGACTFAAKVPFLYELPQLVQVANAQQAGAAGVVVENCSYV